MDPRSFGRLRGPARPLGRAGQSQGNGKPTCQAGPEQGNRLSTGKTISRRGLAKRDLRLAQVRPITHPIRPLCVDRLSRPTTCNRTRDSIQKAIGFLRVKSDTNGVHGRADPDFLDYPNYSTAYALRCFLRFGNEEDMTRIEKMTSYLEGQQFSENSGFGPDSPAYGGWGFGIKQRPTLSSFVDLSHTRRVLASLAQTKPVTPKVRVRAERFLALLQKSPKEKRSPLIPGFTKEKTGQPPHDGGFFSSPNVAYANKGRTEVDPKTGQIYYRSYATATCDGILALLALGIDKSDSRVTDAARWLRANEDWNLPSGIPLDDPSPWAESMRYYHLMVRAETYAALDMSGDWRKILVHFLADKQLPDGSFLNPEGRLMKEDDPMLCTAFAVIALKGLIYDAIED